MTRACLLIHDLTPSPAEGQAACWSLAALLAEARFQTTLLHTATALEDVRHALRHTAQQQGAAYRHLDEFPAFTELAVQPAVPAHRLSLQVSAAIQALAPEIVIVLDCPAQAAATTQARAAGLTTAPQRLLLALDSAAEFRRTQAGQFPQAGRADLGAEFLERTAFAGADAVLCRSPEFGTWLQASGLTRAAKILTLLPLTLAPGASERAAWLAAMTTQPDAPPARPAGLTVAVCVPYYEQPQFLGEALDQLAAQSAAPAEVIVVDDGSHSAEARAAFQQAAADFARPGWQFLVQANAGPAAARNRGAAASSADLLVFCDADNRFRPDMLAKLAAGIEATQADCVTCGFVAFPDPVAGPAADPGYAYVPLGPCEELGLIENVFGDTNFAIRRSVFQALGGFPAGNRAASEDWQFLLQLVRARHALAVVPALLFDYRLAATSHARRNSEWASACAAVGPTLAAADPAWRRLWPHAAGLVRDPRVPRLEAELADLRLTHAHAQEAFHKRERMRRAHVVLAEQAMRRHQEELRQAQTNAAAQWRENTLLVEQTSAHIAGLERTLHEREAKIQRLQATFSWRATAPLRALRRLVIDRPAPPRPAAEPAPAASRWRFRHHLDAPRRWTNREAAVTVRGWCFAEAGRPIQAIRARIGARLYAGVYGGERPDLPLAFPSFPQSARSGFKIDLTLLPEDEVAYLEAQGDDGVWESFLAHPLGAAGSAASPGSYEHWVRTHDTLAPAQMEALRTRAARLPAPVVISVLMPVYNAPARWLERAIESVRAQVYPHWQLCIADDASTAPHIRPLLERYAQADGRIKVGFRERNGHISAATNSALGLATGAYAALFDQDDELAPHALYCIAEAISAHPGAELLYTDEDKIDEQGSRFDPHFKPDWNPDLLTSQNYLSHLAVFRTGLLRELGGLRVGFEGSQDWDLVLRATERIAPAAICHVPRVLYHWRANEGSTALHLGEKHYASDAARRTLEEHFARRGLAVELSQTVGHHWHVTYPLPAVRPLVSIVIPTHNGAELLRLCLASLFARTNYAPYEILVVNNRSDDPAALALLADAAREDGVRVLDYDAPFNYSAINNFAVSHARGDVLCLLNNDIEVISPLWLDEMVGHALRPEIGAVGARLLYPDTRIQHAGVITGLGGVAGHAFKHFAHAESGTPQFRPHLTQNLSAVTAACLVIRRAVYEEAGGFDAAALPVAFNDVDFCLKVEALGYRNLYTPFAELIHHESASRGQEDSPEKIRRFQAEIAAIQGRWGERLRQDPAYNPNLSLDSEDFAFAYPPRNAPLVPES